MFHFNKKHLEDNSIPMWILKFSGTTHYIHHLDADCAWSSKETPDNEATKGSLKFKNCHVTIDDDGLATLKRVE